MTKHFNQLDGLGYYYFWNSSYLVSVNQYGYTADFQVLDATSNEPWGPHGSHLADIAQATRN